MTEFEFAFTLFGLVLGLAMTEVLGGFVRVLKARSVRADEDVAIRIGWQTPLLGLVVTLDLISFWLGAWENRQSIPIDFAPLVFAAVVAGVYYAAASLVFPDNPGSWPDLDDWFERHKGQVALGIFAANVLFSFGEVRILPFMNSARVTPITMTVARSQDVETPSCEAVNRNGTMYHVQAKDGVNMVMTERDGRWVCLMSELPQDQLIDLAARLRFCCASSAEFLTYC